MGILNKTKVYLCGGIENSDCQNWRVKISQELSEIGIVALNPLDKPFINSVPEDESTHKWLAERRQTRDLQSVRDFIKVARRQDLTLIDRSDFVIAYLHPTKASYGSAEELSFSERSLKKVFIAIEGGIEKTPYWLLAMFSETCFYDNLDDIMKEIREIDSELKPIDNKYWRLMKEELR